VAAYGGIESVVLQVVVVIMLLLSCCSSAALLLLLLLFLVWSGMAPGTSYLRYRGEYILPATHLPYGSLGPAVWRVAGPDGLCAALTTLLREPLERRSRGQAAAQVRGDPRCCTGEG